jgi:ABC-type oligopeptide transport system substrate-binding subunit
VKTVFRRNPDYFRPGLPSVDGVDWLVMEDEAAQLAAYRSGQIDCVPGTSGPFASKTWPRSRRAIHSSRSRTSSPT